MANPKITPIKSSEITSGAAGTSNNFADTFIDTLDTKKIQSLEDQVKKLKEDTAKKVYAVKMSAGLLEDLISFVEENAEWTQTESLGVIEVYKNLDKIRHDGVKDNTIYLNSLPLEATHYFLSKSKGRGLKEAENFISIFKPIAVALEEIKKDAAIIQDLEKDLAAAQQGIEAA
jgi:CRISPR/Cas system CSM-associated protein Csm2 small subunit